MKKAMSILFVSLISGCAGVNFDAKEGALYYEPLPYLFVSITDKCVSSVTVVSLPGKSRRLDFTTGYGSSSLSAEFSNGFLTKVGQTSDSKIPETLTSIAALGTAGVLALDGGGAQSSCIPSAVMYPIEEGTPNLSEPLNINLGQ